MIENTNYILEKIIGEGSMAVVFQARHRELESLHAVKKLKTNDFDIQKRLIQEGKILSNIRHPNILSVTDLIKIDGCPSLVMEYIYGPTLSLFLHQIDPSLLQADALARGIMNGVQAAHKKGLIHRDLKPSNILLDIIDGSIVPKIADFGLAKIINQVSPSLFATRSGVTMGTPAYMAPEQIKEFQTVDERADVFSLGVILYEIITGQGCFYGENTMELWEKICNGKYILPEKLNPAIPKRMKRAIQQALEIDRDKRIASVAELLHVWCTDEDGEYAPILSVEEQGFWSDELIEEITQLTQKQTQSYTDTSETIEIAKEKKIDAIDSIINIVQGGHPFAPPDIPLPPPQVDISKEKTLEREAGPPLETPPPPSSPNNNPSVFKETQDISFPRHPPTKRLLFLALSSVLIILLFWNAQPNSPTKTQSISLAGSKTRTWALTIQNGTPQGYLLFKQAREELFKGNYHVSEHILHLLKEEYPSEPTLYAMLGITQYFRGHFRHSTFSFSKARLLAQRSQDEHLALYKLVAPQANTSNKGPLLTEWKELLSQYSDPIIPLIFLVSSRTFNSSISLNDTYHYQQKYPQHSVFTHFELTILRNKEEYALHKKQSTKYHKANPNSTHFALEYAQSLWKEQEYKAVEHTLTQALVIDNTLIDARSLLAKLYAEQQNEVKHLEQLLLSSSDTVYTRELLYFLQKQARHLANTGRLEEAEKYWNFCIQEGKSNGIHNESIYCAQDALVGVSSLTSTEHWDAPIKRAREILTDPQTEPLLRSFYSMQILAIEAEYALLNHNPEDVAPIQSKLDSIALIQNPQDAQQIYTQKIQQYNALHYTPQELQQWLEEYMPSPTSCADIFFVSSAYEKLKQNERSIDLKNKILGQECSKSPRNHILLQARVHLSLAEYHQRNNNTTKTKDHINAFFYLWKTPDPDLALSKRAIQIKESL